VTTVELECGYGAGLTPERFAGRVLDEAGRTTTLSGEIYARYAMVPHPEFVLKEGAARAVIDGRAGLGWIEQGWPKAYLDHVERTGY
jgi:hypothetical protein